MEDNVKFVIVGGGNIAKTYLKAIGEINNAETVALVSSKAQKDTPFHRLPVFRHINEIDIPFDAVIICTPNGLHHQGTIEAAQLGKHVLCEKPLDISLEKMDLMISTCRANKVKLGVTYQRRYSADNPRIKELIDNQQLGQIFSVDLSVKNYRDDQYYNSSAYRGTYALDGGGPFIQQASHYIDLYCWFFGRPDKLVSKMGTFVHNLEVEDHGAAICVHPSGMIGTITASTATKPGFPAKMEVYSNKGYFILENDVITQWEIEGVENPGKEKNHGNEHTGANTAIVEDTQNHEFIIEDFVTAIKTDTEPLITGQSARVATEIILDIYKHQF